MKFWAGFLIIIFLFIVFNASAQEEIWNAKGDKALQNGKYEDAVTFFDKAIKIDKSNKHSYYNRGLAKLYLQKFEESAADFSVVIEMDPKYSDAWNNRGLAYNYGGLYDSALADFNKALELDDKFLEAYINRGTSLLGLGKIEEALKDLNKAIEMDSTNPAVFNERGRANYYLKNTEEAIADFSKAIKLGLKNPKIYYNRANAYFKLEKFDLAIKDYTLVLKSDTANTEALNNRAISYDNIGDKAKANADRKKLAKLTGSEGKFKDIDSIKFVKYADRLSRIEIMLPEGWSFFEHHETDVDEIIISSDKIESFDQPYSVGVRIVLNRNMDTLYKVSEPDAILDFWRGSTMQNAQDYFRYEILSAKNYNRGEYKVLLNKTVLQIQKDFYPVKLYELVMAKKAFICYSYFQSPEVQFGYYQKIFDKAIESFIIK